MLMLPAASPEQQPGFHDFEVQTLVEGLELRDRRNTK